MEVNHELYPEVLRLEATAVLLGQLEQCQNCYYYVSSKFIACKVVISLVHRLSARMGIASGSFYYCSFYSNNEKEPRHWI